MEGRLCKLEDNRAIQRLQKMFAYAMDAGDIASAGRLFATDGAVEMAGGIHEGAAAITRVLTALNGGTAGLQRGRLAETVHTQPVIHVAADGNTALGRWRSFSMLGEHGVAAHWVGGIFENSYVKRHGRWQIARLCWSERFAIPYDFDWSSDAPTRNHVVALPAPTVASERHCAAWPATDVVPFHYQQVGEAAAADTQALRSGRMQNLLDAQAVENVIAAYGYYFDAGRWQEALSLTTDDVQLAMGALGVFQGRDSVGRLFHAIAPAGLQPGYLNENIQIQPVTHVSGDGRRAWCRFRTIVFNGQLGQSAVLGDEVCEAVLVKDDQLWKIRSLDIAPTFYSPYGEEFITTAERVLVGAERVRPDAPTDQRYQPFPAVSISPFHYAHPVTNKPLGEEAVAYQEAPEKTAEEWSALSPALLKRITRLEDERAVETLQYTYGYYVDKALWRELTDLFAADGTLEIGGRGVFAGRDRLFTYFNFLGPSGPIAGRLINHMQMQAVVTVDETGSGARLRGRCMAQGGDVRRPEGGANDSLGVPPRSYFGICSYENSYVKEAGVWKIRSLHGIFRMYTFTKEGWHRTALPLTKLEPKLPPDFAPTVSYEMYPGTYIPPAHYQAALDAEHA